MSVSPCLLPFSLLLLLCATTASEAPSDTKEREILESRRYVYGYDNYRNYLSDLENEYISRSEAGVVYGDWPRPPYKNGYTLSEKRELVRKHNQLRRSPLISPTPSSRIPTLRWDSGLERIAQSYANQCQFWHSDANHRRTSKFPSCGENMSFRSQAGEYGTDIIQSWFNEYPNYDYYSNRCRVGMCLHYTAVIWAKTTHVGCGVNLCNNLRRRGRRSVPNVYLIVCNYGPPGNIWGEKPYQTGS